MSRRRKPSQAVPEEIIAEGSAPHEAPDEPQVLVDGTDSLEGTGEVDGTIGTVGFDEPVEADIAAQPADAADPVPEGDDQVASDAELAAAQDEAGELAAVLPTSAASMDAAQLRDLVEALIFASDKPLTVARLRQLTRVGEIRRLEQALAELTLAFADRGISLQQVSGGYQFRTNTRFSPWVQQLIAGRPVRLSRAQLETLAIIAYRQPITRPEIDDIRGVDSSGTLRVLIERSLIRILGKKEEVGRPMLYGTTREFLDFFSLGDLRELPTLREYSELTAESRQVMSDRLGLDPEQAPVDAAEPIEHADQAEPIEAGEAVDVVEAAVEHVEPVEHVEHE